jgi:class 3 adenylate cyclase
MRTLTSIAVTNLAARLRAEPKAGQVLVSQRVLCEVEELVRAEAMGELLPKGFAKPLPVAEIAGLRIEGDANAR